MSGVSRVRARGLAEAEDRLFGVGEQLLAVVAAFGDPRLDLVGGVEQFAGAGGVGDDLGVAADRAEPGDAAGELVDGAAAAGVGERARRVRAGRRR